MSGDDGAIRSHRRVPRKPVDAARCASMKMTKAKGLHDSNVKDLDRVYMQPRGTRLACPRRGRSRLPFGRVTTTASLSAISIIGD